MSADQPIVVYTSCQDVADFVARFANRVSMTGLRLPSAFATGLGAPVRFEVRLADGTAALRGEGTVIDVADRGGSVAAQLRYELAVGHLRFDARNEVVYERILMLHEDRGEPATGEVNLREVESAAEERYDAPAMPPSRPPPSPPRGPADAARGRGSAPPPRGPSPSADPRASAVPPPPAMRSPSGIPAPGARAAPLASRVGPGVPGVARADTGGAIAPASPARPSDPGGPMRRPAIGPSLPPRPSGPPRPAASAGRFSPAAIARPPVTAPKAASPVRAPAQEAVGEAGARAPIGAPPIAPSPPLGHPAGIARMAAPQPPIGFVAGGPADAPDVGDRTDAAPAEPFEPSDRAEAFGSAAPVAAFSASRSSTQTPIANGFDDEDEDGPTSSHALPVGVARALLPLSPAPLDIPEDGAPALAPHHRDEPTWDAQIAAAPVAPTSSRPSSVPAPEFVPPRIVERYDASDELAPAPHDMAATTPGVVLDRPTSAGSLPRFAARTGPSGTIAGGTIPSATLPEETQIGLSLPGGRPITLMDPALMDGATRQLSLDEADRLVRATRPSAPVGVPIAEDDVEEETHGEGLDGPTMRHDLRQLPPAGEDDE